jgi:hypothetical protein
VSDTGTNKVMNNTERLADELELALRNEGYTQVFVSVTDAMHLKTESENNKRFIGVLLATGNLRYEMKWRPDEVVNMQADDLLPLALEWLGEREIEPKRSARKR